MSDFGLEYWKKYSYQSQIQIGQRTAHKFTVVLHERDAIHLGIDDRKEWLHADAGERKEYSVIFLK